MLLFEGITPCYNLANLLDLQGHGTLNSYDIPGLTDQTQRDDVRVLVV